MKKIVIHKPGSYDRLCMENHPDPQPGRGEVLIDVKAVGINFADCITRMGLYASAKKLVGYPITPGFEVSGVVAATGPGLATDPDAGEFSVGDAVIGVTLFNGYSSMLTLPAAQVFKMPESMNFEQAAAFSAVHLTAWWALHRLAHPQDGECMLVHSAAGGVGSALCQLGRLANLHVTGIVGNENKIEVAQRAGANQVYARARGDVWQQMGSQNGSHRKFDIVMDASGVATLKNSYAHLAPCGRLIVYGFHSMLPKHGGKPNWLKLISGYLRTPRFNPLKMTMENRSVLAFNLSFLLARFTELSVGMHALLRLIDSGALQAPKVTTYAFEDVAKAHADIESGATTGKLVLLTG